MSRTVTVDQARGITRFSLSVSWCDNGFGVGSGTHSGGTVRFSIRFETKRRAWPFAGPGTRPTVRLAGSALVERLGELDLGD